MLRPERSGCPAQSAFPHVIDANLQPDTVKQTAGANDGVKRSFERDARWRAPLRRKTQDDRTVVTNDRVLEYLPPQPRQRTVKLNVLEELGGTRTVIPHVPPEDSGASIWKEVPVTF